MRKGQTDEWNRALIEAGTSQETAKEAAAEIDTLSRDMSEIKVLLAELRIMVRILVALVIAIFLMLLKTML